MKYSKFGKTNPLRLSLAHTYALTGVVFAGNVAVLVALVLGGSQNGDAIAAVAKAAEHVAPPPYPERPTEPRRRAEEPSAGRPSTEKTLRVSVPEDWQWRGCRAHDGGEVEILFAPLP